MAPPRRQPLEQVCRLAPQRRAPVRRLVGPSVLAGLVLGIVAYGLAAVLAPARPVADLAVVAEATPAPNALGVPQSEATATLAPDGAAVAAAPTPDPRVVNEKRLREAVFAPFRSHSGTFGIAVRDLGTGLSVLLNEDIPFQAASLYKLPVMYEVFKQRDERALTFREEMTIGPDDVAMDLETLPWPAGTRITVGTALERMVTISDNSGAFMLTKRVSSRRINDDVIDIGLRRTFIRGETLMTSAGDMLRLLELVAQGQAVNRESSAEMVHLMARQQVRDRIPLLLPPEATVANKTGNWENAAHDVALVYGPRSTFAIALLSEGWTDYDGLRHAMAQATRNVYDLLNDSDFGTTPTPPIPVNQVASYAEPAKLPVASAPQQKPTTATTTSGSRPPASSGSAGGAASGSSTGTTATNAGATSAGAGTPATRPPAATAPLSGQAAPPGAAAQATAPPTNGAAPGAPAAIGPQPSGQEPSGQEPSGQQGAQQAAQQAAQPAAPSNQPASRTPTPRPAAPNAAPAAPAAAPAATPIVKPSGPTIFAPAPPSSGGAPAPAPTKAP